MIEFKARITRRRAVTVEETANVREAALLALSRDGLTLNEIARLRWLDASLPQGSNRIRLRLTKASSTAAVRVAVLSAGASQALEQWAALENAAPQVGWIFPGEDGRMIHRNTLSLRLRRQRKSEATA